MAEPRHPVWNRAAGAVTVGSGLVLAVTGLFGWFGVGRLGGWWLVAHMLASPAFMVGLVLVGLMSAGRHGLIRAGGAVFDHEQRVRPSRPASWLFWAMLIFGFGTILSISSAMLPFFGYAEQERLYVLHRYCALGLIVATVGYAAASRFVRQVR